MGVGVFACVSMLLWLLILQGVAPFKNALNPFYWHAHEMIFGYALAVVAGFLLTAVKTWTNQPMPYGWHLGAIFGAWAISRIMWLGLHASPNTAMLIVAWGFDVLFWGMTAFAVIKAVWVARQKRQIGIIAKLILLMFANVSFYVGVLFSHHHTQQMSLHLALYLIIGVVFTIARRVLPFFISKGIGFDNQGKPNGIHMEQVNSEVLDKLNLVSFFGFVVADLLLNFPMLTALFALCCFVVNLLRLKNWHHPAIWQKPLLWSLVIAFFGMTVSLLLFVISPFVKSGLNFHSLGLHGLALFGIGLMTLSMMSRVSLGHTGRNIHTPPKSLSVMFFMIIISALCRVLMPILGGDYMTWLLISQIGWILAFGFFFITYVGILTKPRADGLFG